jgi:hypothetical protein
MYTAVQLLVRLFCLFVFILICAFIFLRLYGMPDPLLRELVKRANLAGIPVDVEHVALTLRGWRASNVRYYSKHPDDLEPIFHAKEVLLAKRIALDSASEQGWIFDLKAIGISLSPSVEWGIEIPPESEFRTVDQADLSLGFLSDRIEVSQGNLTWMGTRIHVEGTVLRSDKEGKTAPATDSRLPVKKQETVLPVYVNAKQFQALEERLKVIRIGGGADVDIGFSIDTANYADSRILFDFRASDISVRDVGFSFAELNGSYEYPTVVLEKAVLSHENQLIRLEGAYDLESEKVQGEVFNGITSKRLLLLLPQVALDLLVQAGLQMESLPQLTLQFGPAKAEELLNHFEGSFSIRDVLYRQLKIDSLRGRISRANNRLELTKLEGSVRGQEDRAAVVGSCMVGGSATGAVFWDENTEEFGVNASGSMDPNLLLEPLGMVRVATNVIARFQFIEHPPEITLELGAKYTDWNTFFINIQGMGNGVRIHDALLSSVNAAGYYKQGVLRLDPVATMEGIDFLKGMASIDFFSSTATFDAFGSIHPKTIEDAIYPGFNLFGNKIKTAGNTKIKARGKLDWARMKDTDFTAEFEVDQLEIPVARMNSLQTQVTGKGALISVNEAVFDFYGGRGQGDFSIQLDPAISSMPYKMNVEVKNAGFRKFLRFINPEVGEDIDGVLSGAIDFQADMLKDFFESANGKGMVSVTEGQLADLPLFRGFSRMVRKVVPGFNVFSITSLNGTFELIDGMIQSPDAYFEGDVISAKGKGNYTKKAGFDALVQAQILSENPVSKVIQVITSPIFKLFELKLEGTLADPSWRLEKFHGAKHDGKTVKPAGDLD